MSDKPIVTVSVPNDRAKFERECAELVARGYVISSTTCTAHGYESAIDEIWLAVFVLPSAKVV